MSPETFEAVGQDIEWAFRRLKWAWAACFALAALAMTTI
jgi:hypothetical protein